MQPISVGGPAEHEYVLCATTVVLRVFFRNKIGRTSTSINCWRQRSTTLCVAASAGGATRVSPSSVARVQACGKHGRSGR